MSQTSTNPQPRPARYMDFIPSAAQRPASRPAPRQSSPRPAARVTQKTVRRTQPAAPRAPKVVEEYLETTTIIYPNTPPKPQATKPVAESHPVQAQPTKPLVESSQSVSPTPTHQPAPVRTQTSAPAPTETPQEKVRFGIIEDTTPRKATFTADDRDALDAPDGNRYTLGGKSPFLVTADQVDKRPLSNHLPEGTASGLRSTKNIYSRREVLKDSKRPAPTIIDAKSKDRSGIGLAIAIAVTLVLGAVVGTLAYLAFFQ